MRNFVTTFNYADNTISLAVNSNAPGGTKIGGGLGFLAILSIATSVVVLGLCIFGGIWFYRKQKINTEEVKETLN